MSNNVINLLNFYASPSGRMAGYLLDRELRRASMPVRGKTVLVFDGVSLVAGQWINEAERLITVVENVDEKDSLFRVGSSTRIAANFCALPLPEESVDIVIIMHALELAADDVAVLSEIWRVLKGEGKVIAMVPNKSGWWLSKNEKTPFGCGRLYSAYQLRESLQESGFLVNRIRRVLFLPPANCGGFVGLFKLLDRITGWLLPCSGGVIMIEGTKKVYEAVSAKSGASKRKIMINFPVSLAPCGRMSHNEVK